MALNFLKNLYKKVTTDPTPANNLSPEAQARLLNAQTPTAATAKPAASSGSTSSVAGYYRIGNDVYDPQGNYISYTQAQQKGIVPLLAGIPQKTTPATPVIPQAPLAPTDLEKYYKGIASPEKLTAEGDTLAAAQAAETKAREAATTGMENLLEQSQGLFDKLFNSADITAARVGRDQAKTELAAIDKEEIDATNLIKGKAIPSWAAAGQMKIIQESYAGRRSEAAAKVEIANGNLADAKDYASAAYTANLNVINQKISFIKDTLANAKDLTDQERKTYNDLIAKATDYYKIEKGNQNTHDDLFIKLATEGVTGLSPSMSLAELQAIAGKQLPGIAKAKLGTESTKRDTTTGNYLESKRGTDGLVSAGTYLEGLRKFVAAGGSQANYTSSFPQQLYLRQQEIDKLPAELQPKATGGDFAAAIAEEVTYAQQLKDKGFSRKDIEKQYGNNPVPLEVQAALDQVF